MNEFNVPIGFNSDVIVVALGEATKSAAEGPDNSLYVTLGTGVGAEAVVLETYFKDFLTKGGTRSCKKAPEKIFLAMELWS